MTRDEWIAMPEGKKLRRSAIVWYGPDTERSEAAHVQIMMEGDYWSVPMTVAEFEALLFAPAPSASDEYTRAAVRYAEAVAQTIVLGVAVGGNWKALSVDLDAFLRLYRERHDAG